MRENAEGYDWPGRRVDDRTIEAVLPSTRQLNL